MSELQQIAGKKYNFSITTDAAFIVGIATVCHQFDIIIGY